jgi:hypothetical protein
MVEKMSADDIWWIVNRSRSLHTDNGGASADCSRSLLSFFPSLERHMGPELAGYLDMA